MYQKALLDENEDEALYTLDPNTSENLADILYEMAKEQLSTGQHELAAKWLDRSYKILMKHDLDSLCADASELRISILQSSVKALIGVANPDATEAAEAIISTLENELGDKLVVLLLRLELIEAPTQEVFDSEAYALTLRRMTRTVMLNDKTFKTMMHHIRRLYDKSPGLACRVLDELLQERILKEERIEWMEQILVNRFWMATSQKDGPEVVESMKVMLDLLAASLGSPIGASATYAAQTVCPRSFQAPSNLTRLVAMEAR